MSNSNWKPKFSRTDKEQQGWAQGLSLAMSFGAILVVSLWITWKIGGWLDERLSTAPFLTLICMLIGIISSFRMFIRELDKEQKKREHSDDH